MNEDLRAVLNRTDPPGMCCPAADALRAVLDILADPPVPSRMLIPVIREAIIDHLGVTHG